MHKDLIISGKNEKETIEVLARGFHGFIRKWVDAVDLARIDTQNTCWHKDGVTDVCATHEFCDANSAMIAAWEEGGLPDVSQAYDLTDFPAGWEDVWNAAWDLAKQHGFSRPWGEWYTLSDPESTAFRVHEEMMEHVEFWEVSLLNRTLPQERVEEIKRSLRECQEKAAMFTDPANCKHSLEDMQKNIFLFWEPFIDDYASVNLVAEGIDPNPDR